MKIFIHFLLSLILFTTSGYTSTGTDFICGKNNPDNKNEVARGGTPFFNTYRSMALAGSLKLGFDLLYLHKRQTVGSLIRINRGSSIPS